MQVATTLQRNKRKPNPTSNTHLHLINYQSTITNKIISNKSTTNSKIKDLKIYKNKRKTQKHSQPHNLLN